MNFQNSLHCHMRRSTSKSPQLYSGRRFTRFDLIGFMDFGVMSSPPRSFRVSVLPRPTNQCGCNGRVVARRRGRTERKLRELWDDRFVSRFGQTGEVKETSLAKVCHSKGEWACNAPLKQTIPVTSCMLTLIVNIVKLNVKNLFYCSGHT